MATVIKTTSLPNGTLSVMYNAKIEVEGVPAGAKVGFTGQRLPSGLEFDGDCVKGTPVEAGTFQLNFAVRDENDKTLVEQPLTLTIEDPNGDNQGDSEDAPKKRKFPWLLVILIVIGGLIIWAIAANAKAKNTAVTPTAEVELTEVPTDIVETEVPTDIVETEALEPTAEIAATEVPTEMPTLLPTSVFTGWIYDPAANTLTLDGIADGSQDVALTSDVTDPETLNLVRGGTTAIWTTSVPGQVIFCVGDLYVDDILVGSKTNCDGVKIAVAAGTIKLVNSIGPIGGMRWQPAIDGYMTGDVDPCIVDGSCWQLNADETSYSWMGPLDGSIDVHQAAREDVLTWVRSGGVVDITTTVPMQIIGTCHIKIEVLDDNGTVTYMYERHDCGLIEQAVKIPAGHIRLSNSTGDSGGWRLSPWFGFGWRAQEAMPVDYMFINITDFPAG